MTLPGADDVAASAVRLDDAPGDLLALLARPDAVQGPRFYWSTPDGALVVAGYGETYAVTAHGTDRWRRVAEACAQVSTSVAVRHGDYVAPTLHWMGGFAFDSHGDDGMEWDGFPGAWFALPEVVVHKEAGATRLTLAARSEPREALNARAEELADSLGVAPVEWVAGRRAAAAAPVDDAALDLGADRRRALRRQIERALSAIERGEVEKVVLSTSHTIRLGAEVDPVALLARLRRRQPGCFHFLVSPRPGLAFLCATPERLVRVAGERLDTMALAGSAPRDSDPARDWQLGQALLASAKDRAEHALVVEAIADALSGHDLTIAREPGLRRLATIQHLETAISAHLSAPTDVLEAAGRLHPTPALGGTPRAAALGVIDRIETHDRGWYGGAVGWIDGRGDGDMAVAIRSLRVRGDAITAFAGAGIVAGSDPDAEVREIELKLQAALGVLAAG